MTTEGFRRRPRVPVPTVPAHDTTIVAPPEVPRAVAGNMLYKLLPAVMVVAVIGMIALMVLTGGRSVTSNPLFLMFPLMMLMSMVGMFAGGRSGAKPAAELNEERKDYFRYLGGLRDEVTAARSAQRAAAVWTHPAPAALGTAIGSRRMWERTPDDEDYTHVRLGLGSQRLATRLEPPETGPPEDLEPVSMVALRRFVRLQSIVHGLPIAISLRGFPAVGFSGDIDACRALARAMLLSLCTFHGPDVLRVVIVAANPDGPEWGWVKWLPHTGHPTARDGLGAVRMLWSAMSHAQEALGDELAQRGRFSRSSSMRASPHWVVVHDGGWADGTERLLDDVGIDGVTVLDLTTGAAGPAARRGLRFQLHGNRIAALSAAGVEEFADVDGLSDADATALARRLARFHPTGTTLLPELTDIDGRTDPDLLELLGIPDVARYDPVRSWTGRTASQRLRVPIGATPAGSRIELDIKESAEGGMGPHGLCIGATGSGKSEFLRTLVVALLATHSPAELNLVLVDFKGGATFLGLESVPHVAAVITNLEQELAMVDRMRDALSGELTRRQELLRAAGNFANVSDYERARSAGAPLAPLPALFIVVDEFSELLAQKPDFTELFVAIGRLGRSLHIHLLLASQRLEEGKLRGLDSHLSYRIGLKTFSAHESRSVLGVPDAYHLPSEPGSAYLKCDSGDVQRFKACYVSRPCPTGDAADGAAPVTGPAATGVAIMPFGAEPVPRVTQPQPADAPTAEAPTEEAPSTPARSVLNVLVAAMAGLGPPAHEVWLPPLDGAVTLDALGVTPGRQSQGRLRLSLGLVDRPFDQRRDALQIDLAGAAGNVAIVGGPQSGKSTAARTLIMSAAATHSPRQVQFYCLDFGGGTLASVAGLPHVGGVASRATPDAVRRTVAEVMTVLRSREEAFAAAGVESMRDYRNRRAAQPQPDDRFGDVFLVIDGASVLRGDWESLDDTVAVIATEGLSYGVHLILTASRWAEIRPAVKDMIGTRLELKLGDPMDSECSRTTAALVPAGRPGRGITADELHSLIALPRFDAQPDAANLGDGVAAAVATIAALWRDVAAPRVRMLAERVGAAELEAAVVHRRLTVPPHMVAVGIGESELAPVLLDFDSSPHLLAFADVEHGKTTLLRTLARGLTGNGGPDQVKLVVVDYRRTLLGWVPDAHLAGYASTQQTAMPMLAELARYLSARLPGDDVTPAQLRSRDWWSGPQIYVVVDDYDLVATDSGNPVHALLDLLSHARDIGMHLILTRRSGGVGRALYDPVIARLRDLAADTLLMSGDPDEGYLVGRARMQRLVPGRGELFGRSRRAEMVQIAEPDSDADAAG